uniref:RRM domain-containing protein n=1 Tax=Anopheles dirus TaxID=7168 RepID=A0A182NAY0_9DIPT
FCRIVYGPSSLSLFANLCVLQVGRCIFSSKHRVNMTSSHRRSDCRTSRRHEDDYRRPRSVERRNRHSRSRSRSNSRDRYRRRLVSRTPQRSRSSHRKSPSHSSSRSRIRVDSPAPSRCLGVFGLSVYTTEPYLNDIFRHFGTVERAFVIYDAKTRLSRGFGFVYFKTEEEAGMARANCNGLQIHGRRIRVDYSITDQPHAPTPGVYMGRRDESPLPSSRSRSRNESYRHRRRSRSGSRSSNASR